DRKSTRLNSSHVSISYAVFCLKKKKETLDVRLGRLSECKRIPKNVDGRCESRGEECKGQVSWVGGLTTGIVSLTVVCWQSFLSCVPTARLPVVRLALLLAPCRRLLPPAPPRPFPRPSPPPRPSPLLYRPLVHSALLAPPCILFFNHTPSSDLSTLSLHDALPI